MRLGVYTRIWLFLNLLPTDSYVMCDHFSNVAGRFIVSAMEHWLWRNQLHRAFSHRSVHLDVTKEGFVADLLTHPHSDCCKHCGLITECRINLSLKLKYVLSDFTDIDKVMLSWLQTALIFSVITRFNLNPILGFSSSNAVNMICRDAVLYLWAIRGRDSHQEQRSFSNNTHTHTHTHTHWGWRHPVTAMKHFYYKRAPAIIKQKMCKKKRQNYRLDFPHYFKMCIRASVWKRAKILIGTSLKWIEPTEDKLLNLAIKAMWFTVNSTRLTVPQLRA